MAFTKPYITDKFTAYPGDVRITSLSLAVWVKDDFTKNKPAGNIKVMIKEGGEILVFGLNMNFTTVIDIQTLYKLSADAGAFMIAAHPFRGYPCHAIADFEKAADLVLKRPVFDKVYALEGFNGRNMDGNNVFA